MLEIFENGNSIEKVKLSTLTDRKEMHSLLESKGFPLKGSSGGSGGGGGADEEDTAIEEAQEIRRVRESSTKKYSHKRSRTLDSDSEMRRTTRKLILVVLATFIGLGCLVLRSGKYNRGVHKRADVTAASTQTSNGKSSNVAGGNSSNNKSSGAATRRMVTATA